MPWGFTLATDLNYYTRYGYSNEQMNSRDWVWNAQLSKSFLKGKLILTAVGFDLLGQLSNITYSLNAQGSMETWKNVIPGTECSALHTGSVRNRKRNKLFRDIQPICPSDIH